MLTSKFVCLYCALTEVGFISKGYFVDSFCWQFIFAFMVVWIPLLTLPRTAKSSDTRAPLFCLTFLVTNSPSSAFTRSNKFSDRLAEQHIALVFNLSIRISLFHTPHKAYAYLFSFFDIILIYLPDHPYYTNLTSIFLLLCFYWWFVYWLKKCNSNITFGESKMTWLLHMIGSFDVNWTEHQKNIPSILFINSIWKLSLWKSDQAVQ